MSNTNKYGKKIKRMDYGIVYDATVPTCPISEGWMLYNVSRSGYVFLVRGINMTLKHNTV